jgi:HEAT repeat protein
MLATAAGAAMGAAATEALLFANFDLAQLPLLYVALGVTTFAITLVTSGLLAGADRARIYIVLPIVLAVAVAAERAAAATGIALVYAALWLGMNIVTTLQGIAAWGLAGAVCDVRQAKRLFPLFNAAKIAGTVAGSLAVAAAVRFVSVADLLVVWAAALALSAAIAFALRRRVPRSAEPDEGSGLVAEMRRGFAIVRASPLLRLVSVSLVFFSLLYFALALPFSRGARAAYPDAAELASFLGLFNGTTTLAALGASLFVANRLYARVGVVNAIVAFAGVYLAGFAAIAVSTAFAVLVAARFAQTVWLSGIADTAYQALFNPVPPERRDQIRAFMEGVPGQAGIALAGIALLVGDSLEPRTVALSGVVASAITIWVLLRARAAYQRALGDALRAGRPQPFVLEADPFGALRTDAQALAVTVAGLRDADPAMRRVSAEVLRLLALPSTAEALSSSLDDPDEDVRRSAVRGLAALGLADPIAPFANDPDPEIRVSVALTRGPQAVAALAMHSDVAVRRAVAAAIAERGGPPAALVMLLDDGDASVRRAAADALRTTELTPADLEPLLGAADPLVAGRAFDALAEHTDPVIRARLVALARGASTAAGSECDRLRRIGTRADDAGAFVVDAVRERARRPALRAVHAALALGGRGDADLVIESLESRDRERRASAIELVEAVGGDLVRPLLPLWEDGVADAGSARELEELATSDQDTLVRDAARRAISGGRDMKAETLPTISLMERVLFLRKVSLFADLAPSDLKQIAGLSREEQHVDGAVLGRQGEVGDRSFVIVSGTVRVASGERVIARRSAGDVIGEMSVVTDVPRVASLICEGDVRVLVLSRRDFDAIIRDRPQVALAIIRVLSARLAEQLKAA